MIAFKGFNPNLKSVMGNGRKETCCFHRGITLEETESKTGRNGFHCCENPFECMAYYSMDGRNRFFRVEAAGDINEDGSGKIACTKITLVEELDAKKIAMYAMKYIVEHPNREGWQQYRGSAVIQADEAIAEKAGHIAIARGKNPRVKGPAGSILGLLIDGKDGIRDAKLVVPGEEQAGKWLRLLPDRKIQEETNEEKAG